MHFEIPAENLERAKKFYSSVLGWKYKDSSMPGIEYYLIDGITPAGGINPLTEPSKTKAITVYFGTDDIDSTIKKIKDGGGTAEQKAPIPGQGWFAACTDPDGNTFSLFQSDPSVTMETEHEHQETRA